MCDHISDALTWSSRQTLWLVLPLVLFAAPVLLQGQWWGLVFQPECSTHPAWMDIGLTTRSSWPHGTTDTASPASTDRTQHKTLYTYDQQLSTHDHWWYDGVMICKYPPHSTAFTKKYKKAMLLQQNCAMQCVFAFTQWLFHCYIQCIKADVNVKL